MPVLKQQSCHAFILAHALWPGIAHRICAIFTSEPDLPLWALALLYGFAYINMIVREGKALKQIGTR